jgi:glutathione synthase/RimK-type ligase-like ATP-grasp enzyme
MSKRCAFLTMQDTRGFYIYDYLAHAPLHKLGWTVEEVPWDDPAIDWNQFEVVVIRSPWDYQKKPHEFMCLLETIDRSTARLFNPLEICRWNMNKVYLRDLVARGVATIPTIWLDRLDSKAFPQLFSELQSERIVVKPTVGANADDTFVLSLRETQNKEEALSVFANKPLMVQPFVEAIVNEGEYSLFYFGGEFSHAIQKTPKQDDFRVQEEHGGVISSVVASEELLRAGRVAIDAIGQPLLYARADFVRFQDGPALMELELIEPSLYFSFDEQSPDLFAAALDRFFAA